MKLNFRFLQPLLGLLLLGETVAAQPAKLAVPAAPISQRMADAFIRWHPDSILVGTGKTARWNTEQGLMLKALERVWERSGDAKYFTYIKKDLDQFVQQDGRIRTYQPEEYNLDNLSTGPALLLLSQVSLPGNGNEKYIKAAQLLRKQLEGQPRTKEGGFWRRKIYENQLWLAGLYLAEPFYAEYSRIFNQPAGFDDIARQFALVEKNLVDPKTGLLHHGYDESRPQQGANKITGQPLNFWARGIGWYGMALVDVLDYFPQTHPQRPALVKALQRLAPVLARYQDPKTGTWSVAMNQGTRQGNYAEAAGSGMLVYALAKGARLGYLDKSFAKVAQKGYDGLLKSFVTTEPPGALSFTGTVSAGGLGDEPYLSAPLLKNDLKGVGPFILASTEMEIAAESSPGQNKTVGLDYHFNHEMRKSPLTGEPEQWHYTWEERTHGGFWLWGQQFRELGAKTVAVPAAPTAAGLKNLSVYIIVDPDSRKESPKPNYIQPADAKVIADWVRGGGTLVLFANDTANAETKNFNHLAKNFGVQFTDQSVNMVKGDQFEQGKVDLTAGKAVFTKASTAFVKELSVLSATSPAQPLVTNGGKVIMATATLGKGRVFVLGDPWLYNEYVDGRKIPAEYQNFQAGKDLATWLLNNK